jgi:hypothetical protein
LSLASLGATRIATAVTIAMARYITGARIPHRAGDVATSWFARPVFVALPFLLLYCLVVAIDDWRLGAGWQRPALAMLFPAYGVAYLVSGVVLMTRLTRGCRPLLMGRWAATHTALSAIVWMAAHIAILGLAFWIAITRHAF